MQPAGAIALCDQLSDPRLDDWTLPGVQRLDLRAAEVDPEHLIAFVRKASGCYRAHVSHSKYADRSIHTSFLSLNLSRGFVSVQISRRNAAAEACRVLR